MAENQHRLISGYRELTAEEIARMNEVKGVASQVGDLCMHLRSSINMMPEGSLAECADKREAKRWLEQGEMQAQQAFMALTRAIARPTTF